MRSVAFASGRLPRLPSFGVYGGKWAGGDSASASDFEDLQCEASMRSQLSHVDNMDLWFSHP